MFFQEIQETDAASSRPWFASHTDLWANLSHWICLLHRSSFQDKPRPETAKKDPYKPDNISKSWTRSWELSNCRQSQVRWNHLQQPIRAQAGTYVSDTPPKPPYLASAYGHQNPRKYVKVTTVRICTAKNPILSQTFRLFTYYSGRCIKVWIFWFHVKTHRSYHRQLSFFYINIESHTIELSIQIWK